MAALVLLALCASASSNALAASNQALSSRLNTSADTRIIETPEAPLKVILSRFASMPGLSARFREEKRIALLRDPLVSEGSIYFAPPESLARYVRTPVASVVLLVGDRVSYDFKGDRGELDIDSHPMIRGMSSIIRLLLAGDADALTRLFEVKTVIADSDDWEIFFLPRLATLRKTIASVRVRGTGGKLRDLRVAEHNGDETTTIFSDVDIARSFSSNEAENIFRLPES